MAKGISRVSNYHITIGAIPKEIDVESELADINLENRTNYTISQGHKIPTNLAKKYLNCSSRDTMFREILKMRTYTD